MRFPSLIALGGFTTGEKQRSFSHRHRQQRTTTTTTATTAQTATAQATTTMTTTTRRRELRPASSSAEPEVMAVAAAGYRPAHGWLRSEAQRPIAGAGGGAASAAASVATPVLAAHRPAEAAAAKAEERAAAMARAVEMAKEANAATSVETTATATAAERKQTAAVEAVEAEKAVETEEEEVVELAVSCRAAERRFLLGSSRGLSQTWPLAFLNDYALFDPPELSIDDRTASFMDSEEVARALHVDQAPKTVWDAWRTSDRKTDYPPGGAASWPGPAPGWTFKSQYAACNPDAAPGVPSMVDFHRDLAKRLPGRLLIFNGDADPCVSYEGTRRAVRKIGFRQKQGGGYRPWFFNRTAATPELLAVKDRLFGTSLSLQEEGPQLGGYVVDYEHGLSFATVHGSGHMVPQARPREALRLLRHLLSAEDGTPLSPPLPADEKRAAMASSEFGGFTDKWTREAMSAEYIGGR